LSPLELTLAEKTENFNRAAPPPCRQAALPRRKIVLSLKRKTARAKTKSVKAIFLLDLVLANKAAGL
jgi:hypothetical protein